LYHVILQTENIIGTIGSFWREIVGQKPAEVFVSVYPEAGQQGIRFYTLPVRVLFVPGKSGYNYPGEI